MFGATRWMPVVVAALMAGCVTPPVAPGAEVPESAATPVVVEVVGDKVSVDGQPVTSDADALARALRRSGYYELVLRTGDGADEETLARIATLATKAHFAGLRLEAGDSRARVAMRSTSGASRRRAAAIVVWMQGDTAQVWRVDNFSGASEELGSFRYGKTDGEALRPKIEQACSPSDCHVALTLGQDTPFVASVAAWSRIAGAAAAAPTSFDSLRLHPPSSPDEAAAPLAKLDATQVRGRLPPSLIQAIVRARFSDFRACYEAGLGRNPELSGRITARFIIDQSGAVSHVSDGGSSLADTEVRDCVLKAFYGLRFPAPQGGIVTVSYPIQLAPQPQ